ncbi:MAG TPA: hypothetical protein VG097_02055 [Gemmata sp.]|jgi:hypothetical protein|nr:hypothetical protein [Gemmata sp.]
MPEPLPIDDNTEPMFNFPQKRESAESILSEPGESEDDVFGSSGGNKIPIPTLPEILPSPPPPAQLPAAAYAQPVPVPVLIPPPIAPVPVAQASANPFAFEMEQPSPPVPAIPQPRPVAPQPVPVAAQARPVAPQPVPIPHSIPKPVAASPEPIEELPEEEPVPKPARAGRNRSAPKASSGISKGAFFAVVGYAVLVTLAAIYGLFIKSGEKLNPDHPLSTIPDSFGEFDPASRKKVSQYRFPVDGELPLNQKALLGGKIEIGQLEIEPLKVEIRPLKVITEGQREKRDETRRDSLVMQLRIKNTSSDLSIFPMDPALTRKARPDDKLQLGTRLVVGGKQTFYGGGIEWPVPVNVKRKYEEQQEKDNTPLKPGETREYVVFTDSDQQIIKTVKEFNDTILWRVQVRRGLIEFNGKDIPVTAIIGVEFKSADVKSPD